MTAAVAYELPARVIPRALPGRTVDNEQAWLDQWRWRETEIALQRLQRLPLGNWMAYPAGQFARLAFAAAVHGYRLESMRHPLLPEWLRVRTRWES